MNEETRRVLAHLGSCFAALYRTLGEAAPSFDDDAMVVAAYEASRAFGELTLEARGLVGGPLAPLAALSEVLERSVADDHSGRLALYCLAVVVGPRLLVSLRDARDVLGPDAPGLLDEASDLVVGQIVTIRDLAAAAPPSDDAAPAAASARALAQSLEDAGYADSLGLGA